MLSVSCWSPTSPVGVRWVSVSGVYRDEIGIQCLCLKGNSRPLILRCHVVCVLVRNREGPLISLSLHASKVAYHVSLVHVRRAHSMLARGRGHLSCSGTAPCRASLQGHSGGTCMCGRTLKLGNSYLGRSAGDGPPCLPETFSLFRNVSILLWGEEGWVFLLSSWNVLEANILKEAVKRLLRGPGCAATETGRIRGHCFPLGSSFKKYFETGI